MNQTPVKPQKTDEEMDDIFGIPASYDEENDPIEDDMEGPDGGALISPPEKVDRESDPFSGLLGDASSKLQGEEPQKPGAESKPEEEAEAIRSEETSEEGSETGFDSDIETDIGSGAEDFPPFVPDEPATEPEPQPSKPPLMKSKKVAASGSQEKKRDPIMMVISVMLVLVLTVAGFFIIPTLFEGEADTDTTVQTETEPATPETAPEEAQAVLTPVEPESESEVTSSTPEADEPAATDQPVYGLMGDIMPEANDGFSIVLHSLRNEEAARAQAADLSSDGYRVLVGPRTVQGETVWRVSVGQFPTIPEAQEAAQQLPSPFNTNNFIQRIQIN
jgi:cell division septation protein DedD